MMPSLSQIKQNSEKKFKKTEYRPWDETGSIPSNFTDNDETIISVDPNKIKNWELHDRPESELGNIEGLAQDFKAIGQQLPCIVRKLTNEPEHEYELIAGERRWRAAKLAKINLKIIIKDITDKEAALIQSIENESRKGLSDYAKGMQYHKLIENNVLTQKDLIDRLGKTKQYISALLSFSKIPKDVINEIKDMSKISARSAEYIKQLVNKGDLYKKIVIEKSQQIREGKLAGGNLLSTINRLAETREKIAPENNSEKIFNSENRHLFTWRTDNNGLPSIHIPKTVLQKVDRNLLTEKLIRTINDALK